VVRNINFETDSLDATSASLKCHRLVPVAALPRLAGSIAV